MNHEGHEDHEEKLFWFFILRALRVLRGKRFFWGSGSAVWGMAQIKIINKIDELLNSLLCSHYEERNDVAISAFQSIKKGGIASLRSQ